MKPARMLVGLSLGALVALGLGGTPAYAAGGLADGSIAVGDSLCSWSDAATTDAPPTTLTMDHSTVQPTCGGSISGNIISDPTISFDDAAGTAATAELDVSAARSGVSCSYRVTDASLTRQGTARTYTGGPFTATKISGDALCASTDTVDSVSLTFH
ncbi:MAG: hypothetical protein WCA46_28960 [Actinocatenispora sp.]